MSAKAGADAAAFVAAFMVWSKLRRRRVATPTERKAWAAHILTVGYRRFTEADLKAIDNQARVIDPKEAKKLAKENNLLDWFDINKDQIDPRRKPSIPRKRKHKPSTSRTRSAS